MIGVPRAPPQRTQTRRVSGDPAPLGISAKSGLASVLGLHIAGFTTGPAVPLAVFAEANLKQALAQPAIFVARAPAFGLVADAADEFLCHMREISANPRGRAMSDGRWTAASGQSSRMGSK